jgi:hypothetical protein
VPIRAPGPHTTPPKPREAETDRRTGQRSGMCTSRGSSRPPPFLHVSTDLKGGRIVRANVEVSESCWGGRVLVWGGPCEGTFPIQSGPPFFPRKPGFASWPPPPTWSARPVGHPGRAILSVCLMVGSRGFYHDIEGK